MTLSLDLDAQEGPVLEPFTAFETRLFALPAFKIPFFQSEFRIPFNGIALLLLLIGIT